MINSSMPQISEINRSIFNYMSKFPRNKQGLAAACKPQVNQPITNFKIRWKSKHSPNMPIPTLQKKNSKHSNGF